MTLYKIPSTILRLGILVGLSILALGIVAKYMFKTDIFITIGLLTLVLTPLTSLVSISIELAKRRNLHELILAQLATIIIVISIVLSILK